MASFTEFEYLTYFVLVGLVTGFITWAATRYILRLRSAQRKGSKVAQRIMDESYDKAHNIISRAEEEAHTIVSDAEAFTGDVKSEMRTAMHEATTHFTEESEDQLKKMLSSRTRESEMILARAEKVTQKHMELMAKRFEERLELMEKTLAELAKQERLKISKVAQASAQTRLKMMEQKLNAQLPAIVEHVVGKSIPLEEHEKLVKEAVQAAASESWAVRS